MGLPPNPANSTLNRLAFIGNYLPRQCGIATFTTDLCEAIAAEYGETSCIAVPVNDLEAGYAYPARVRFELVEKDIESYRRAADFLNINNVDLVCLQHEYGIFGGRAGSHILALLRELRMPIVTTLHTILRAPDPDQRRADLLQCRGVPKPAEVKTCSNAFQSRFLDIFQAKIMPTSSGLGTL